MSQNIFGPCHFEFVRFYCKVFVTLRANFYSWIFSHIGVTVIAQLLTMLG